MQGNSIIPYLFYKVFQTFLFLLVLEAIPAFAQDVHKAKASKDTVFPKIDTLKAATVTATLRPKLKGDTLEYNTENVRLRANANVEELLGRLPGLQIDNNGNITYNGEKIEHLLVDGEDIFGNSPTLVTRNFDASKIARVQVLDRKSDQTLFTGVDDGTRTKTLNLVLKTSAKDGYFGKVEAGGDTEGYYSINGALAAFRDKEQFTALGLASNTGVSPLSSGDGASAGINFQSGSADPLGGSAGVGVPRFTGAALHYANSWKGPADHILGNYQYSHYFTQPVTSTMTLQTEPGTLYRQNQQSRSSNQQDQHWFYGTYDWMAGKSTFKFIVKGNGSSGENLFSSASSSSFNDTLVNGSNRSIQDKLKQSNILGTLLWRNPIGNGKQNLSAIINLTRAGNDANGYLYSLNKFYQSNGNLQSEDTVDQRKQIKNRPVTLTTMLSFTRKLWNDLSLVVAHNMMTRFDDPLQGTYNRGDGKYEQQVDSLSNHFQTLTSTQQGTLNLQNNNRKFSYTIGSDLLFYRYKQNDLQAHSILRQNYINPAPHIFMAYTPNSFTNWKFFYSITTQQPTPDQLQPIKNNTDPLHLFLGNPDLRPAVNQNFHLEYHRIKAWIVNFAFNLSLTNNSISNKILTDSLGRQISQPVNVDGGRTGAINFTASRKISGFDVSFYSTVHYSKAVNYIGADLSNNSTFSDGAGFELNRTLADKYNLRLHTNLQYFNQTSSINTAAAIHYWSQNHYGALTIYLSRNLEIATMATYTWQQKTSAFPSNTSVLLWNSSISRSFLQNKLVIKAAWNNILDQNAGITRTNVNNTITETSSNILGRFWMLSAIYHFDKKFGKK